MNDIPDYLNVHQVAQYLDLNEKKIYNLAKNGAIPATKVTGKWLFPKRLLDRWLLDSSFNGIYNDRLIIAGSDDPLVQFVLSKMALQYASAALIGYTPTNTQQGLLMLEKGHVDVCAIHWGNAQEAKLRHPSLLQRYAQHKNWILLHAFERKQGLIFHPRLIDILNDTRLVFDENLRWARRIKGCNSEKAMTEWLQTQAMSSDALKSVIVCLNERELGSSIAQGAADIGFGSQSCAGEFGLAFHPISNEAFELVIPKNIYFRTLVQDFIVQLKDKETLLKSKTLGGYHFKHAGKHVWNAK